MPVTSFRKLEARFSNPIPRPQIAPRTIGNARLRTPVVALQLLEAHVLCG
jgi:hypothetical protein